MNNTPGMTNGRFEFGNLVISGFPRWEAEALYHAAQGLSYKEAARAMGISHHSVRDAWVRAQKRAEAKNQKHLIAQAFLRGWVRARDTTVCAVLICAVVAASVADTGQWARRLTRRPEEVVVVMATA